MPRMSNPNDAVLDLHVRRALHDYLIQHKEPGVHTRIMDEVPFSVGKEAGRADVVVIDRRLHCYEIKSDADSLDRLKRQVRIYTPVMDRLSVVVTPRHMRGAKRRLPTHWGVFWYENDRIYQERAPQDHDGVVARELAGMLWKAQALQLLSDASAPLRGTSRMNKDSLHALIADTCDLETIRDAVCLQYKQHYVTPRTQLRR